VTDLDRGAHRRRLAAAQNELMTVDYETRRVLEAAAVHLGALARADDADPLARQLADRCRSLLDRRRLAVTEIHEQAREMGVDQ
jgi:hypothetical protein